MVALYLIIVGIMLLGNHMVAVGLIALVIGACASHDTARMCTIVVGLILLLAVPGWALAGLVGVIIGCLSRR